MFGYLVKVRGTAYLWGSSTLTTDLGWPLLLAISNDVLGEPIDLVSETSDNQSTNHGTLQAGQSWTLPLIGLRGVSAACTTDTTVTCTILLPHLAHEP
jgi:hypothetical protein